MLMRRSLTREEAELLHEELKTTPNILGYSVKELLRFQDMFVAEIEGCFAGVCICRDLHFGWTDIAVLYVLPEFRGRGLGTGLYTTAWEWTQRRRRHIFTMSCSAEVIHLMQRLGMELTTSMSRVPPAVHLHMNRHMMNWYRISEAIRKSRTMTRTSPLTCGTMRCTGEASDKDRMGPLIRR